jgi:hypothetical protein
VLISVVSGVPPSSPPWPWPPGVQRRRGSRPMLDVASAAGPAASTSTCGSTPTPA